MPVACLGNTVMQVCALGNLSTHSSIPRVMHQPAGDCEDFMWVCVIALKVLCADDG